MNTRCLNTSIFSWFPLKNPVIFCIKDIKLMTTLSNKNTYKIMYKIPLQKNLFVL